MSERKLKLFRKVARKLLEQQLKQLSFIRKMGVLFFNYKFNFDLKKKWGKEMARRNGGMGNMKNYLFLALAFIAGMAIGDKFELLEKINGIGKFFQ